MYIHSCGVQYTQLHPNTFSSVIECNFFHLIFFLLIGSGDGGRRSNGEEIKNIDKAHLPINTQYINQWGGYYI